MSLVDRRCLGCKKPLQVRHNERQYCSAECRRAAQRVQRVERHMTPEEVEAYLEARSREEWRLLPAWEGQR